MSFADFMTEQLAEMAASGLPPEEWIERHAAEFRAAHPVDPDTGDTTQ